MNGTFLFKINLLYNINAKMYNLSCRKKQKNVGNYIF